VTSWQWGVILLAALLLGYAAFVGTLVAMGRRAEARALGLFVPDCLVLFRRLLADARVSRRAKVLLLAVAAYLAMPVDLVPDFIPVAGQLDDAIIVAIALRTILRGAGADLIREHWPGPAPSLRALLRLAGRPAAA